MELARMDKEQILNYKPREERTDDGTREYQILLFHEEKKREKH